MWISFVSNHSKKIWNRTSRKWTIYLRRQRIDVIASSTDLVPHTCGIKSFPLSDHDLLFASFKGETSTPDPLRLIRRTNWKRYSKLANKSLQKNTPVYSNGGTHMQEKETKYVTDSLLSAIRQTCPRQVLDSKPKKSAPWWMCELDDLRGKVRKADDVQRRLPTQLNISRFRELRKSYSAEMRKERRSHFREQLDKMQSQIDTSKLNKIINPKQYADIPMMSDDPSDPEKPGTDRSTLDRLVNEHFPGSRRHPRPITDVFGQIKPDTLRTSFLFVSNFKNCSSNLLGCVLTLRIMILLILTPLLLILAPLLILILTQLLLILSPILLIFSLPVL